MSRNGNEYEYGGGSESKNGSKMIHTLSLHQRGSNHPKHSTLIYTFCQFCQSQYKVGIDSPSVAVGLHLHLSRILNEVVCV